MTAPRQTHGLSIAAWKPTIVAGTSYTPRGSLVDDQLAPRLNAYSHTISAWLGFDKASMTLAGNQSQIERWIEEGLARYIEVNGPGLIRAFEGFVDGYSANIGSLTSSGGPISEVVNRCLVTYNPIDPNADPPQSGPPTETTLANDTDSQALYGIIESVVSGGQATEDDAEYLRDAYIEDKRLPQTSGSLAIPAASTPQVTLSILGYWAYLAHYVFNDATNLTTTAGAKVLAALGADPNGLFSTDYTQVGDPAILVAARERDNRNALDVIKAVVSRGGGPADYERWLFGIYENRRARYEAIPTTPEYQHRVAGRTQAVETYGTGALVYPWDVRPGKWLFQPDYLPGRGVPAADFRSDPRFLFIESVTYTMPWTVSISGLRVGKLDQIIANYGVGGIA